LGINLDIETRYRRGIFLPHIENWSWIQTVSERLKPNARKFVWSKMNYEEALSKFKTAEINYKTALQTLQLTEDNLENLLQQTDSLIAQNKYRESDYYDAMWIIKKFKNQKAEFANALREYSDFLEIRAVQTENGWPALWAPEFCELWKELGGNQESARAWANKYWLPEDVLDIVITNELSVMPMEERLNCTNPPLSTNGTGFETTPFGVDEWEFLKANGE
jgi:hypothetical protein